MLPDTKTATLPGKKLQGPWLCWERKFEINLSEIEPSTLPETNIAPENGWLEY